MHSFTTIAAVAAVASTAMAYEYEEDIFAREAEPILGLNHIGKWTGQAFGSIAGGFRQKSGGHSGGPEGGSPQIQERSLDDEEFLEALYARYAEADADADAEPILGLNHIGKWTGQAFGSIAGGFRSKSGGHSGAEQPQIQERSVDDEEFLEALYARYAEADAEPILGLNHIGKWIGKAAGSVVGGFRSKSGGGGGGQSQQQIQERSLDDDELLEILYARYAAADAEPILGLNHIGKWTGQAFGSIAGGFRSKSGGGHGGEGSPSQESPVQRREAEAEAEDDEFWFEY